MGWNTIMVYTSLLFLIVLGTLGYAVTFPALLVPAGGAGFLLIVGQFVVVHYQIKYRDRARDLFRVYIFPVCGLLILAAWLINLARHHQLVARF